MKLLPDREQSRPLAIGLLIVALIVVYFVGFHWFVMRQLELGDEIGQLRGQVARFKASVAQRDALEQRLQELRRSRMDSALFLPGGDFNVAAAGLIQSLREWVDAHAEDTELCQITNTAPRRAGEPERFESVRVNVRMQCPLQDVVRILYEMENSVPLVFVDNLMVNPRLSLDQRGRRGRGPYGLVEVRFDMVGYLDQPGGEQRG